MDQTTCRLTVFFEQPFWVGIYERTDAGRYEACKITFGAEPKDYKVYAFLLKNWGQLRFSPAVEASVSPDRAISPKRMQRIIRRQLSDAGTGTKAQQALTLQQEQGKQQRRLRSRTRCEEEQARKFALRQEKRKEKHRGH